MLGHFLFVYVHPCPDGNGRIGRFLMNVAPAAGGLKRGTLKRETRLEKPNAIGELNERSLHRALKAHYATPGSVTEQAVDGFVADVLIGGRIVEIHTGSFWPLKKKLPRLLERFAVTLVYPVAQDRYIVMMPDGAGAQGAPPVPLVPVAPAAPALPVAAPVADDRDDADPPDRPAQAAQVAEARFRVRRLRRPDEHPHPAGASQPDPRRGDDRRGGRPGEGFGPRGRARRPRRRYGRGRGWIRIDRRLVEVARTHRLTGMADLFALVDAGLPEPFTTLDLARAMRSPRRLGQQAAFCFRAAGVSKVRGKAGNALLYRRTARG